MSNLSNTSILPKLMLAVCVALAIVVIFFASKSNNDAAVTSDTEIVERGNGAGATGVKTTQVKGSTVMIGEAVDTPEEKLRNMYTEISNLDLKQDGYEQTLSQLQKDVAEIKKAVLAGGGDTGTTPTALEEFAQNGSDVIDQLTNRLQTMEGQLQIMGQGGNPNDYITTNEKPVNSTSSDSLIVGDKPQLSDPYNQTSSTNTISVTPSDNDEWILPLDAQQTVDDNGKPIITFPEITKDTISEIIETNSIVKDKNSQPDKPKGIPFATIEDGSTLLRSKTLTALLGRVPIGNQVTNAYPFKLKVGRMNLASNYQTIPNLDGITVQGITTGDKVLKCVIAEVKKLTFTFIDGTITTVSANMLEGEGDSQRLGYLSDQQGVPCISGIMISNSVEYVSTTMFLDAFQAGARALADNERTRTSEGSSSTETVTGDGEKVMFGEFLAGGAESGGRIAKEFMGDAYAAIYVPNNTLVDLHIEREIPIDYNPAGRKLSYEPTEIQRFTSSDRL